MDEPENIETFCQKCGDIFTTGSDSNRQICLKCVTGEPQETVNVFIDAVNEKIDYFRDEFNLSYAEAVGALEIIKADIINELRDE